MLGWKRLRFSDIETGTRDPTLRQGLDKIIGPHEPASGNVDQPGVVLHGSKLSFRHHAFGLASQCCGKDDQIGVYQSPSEVLERYGSICAWRRFSSAANGGGFNTKRLQQAKKRLAYAARTAYDRDVRAE